MPPQKQNTEDLRHKATENAEKKRVQDKLTNKAQSHLRKAREAEKQSDPAKMSPEDRALYHYLQAVTTVLEQEYDILLEAQQP